MDKKGDLLNQLAIISDLIEKANMYPLSSDVIFNLDEDEYRKVFQYFNSKYSSKRFKVGSTFTIKLGEVNFIFNKSSV